MSSIQLNRFSGILCNNFYVRSRCTGLSAFWVNSLSFPQNAGITICTFFPLFFITSCTWGKPSSANIISPWSNLSSNPDSKVISESLFLSPATCDLKLMNPDGVIPVNTFAVNPVLLYLGALLYLWILLYLRMLLYLNTLYYVYNLA